MTGRNYFDACVQEDPKEFYEEIERRYALQEEFLGVDKPVNRVEPLVSICVITYQHEPYIEQCLDSLLEQQTTFPYEIVIGEDQSTDGTRELCVEYAKRFPDRIRLFLRDRRLSHMVIGERSRWFNGRWTHQACRGRYIALCEGDDYWINPKKLQMQVNLLEREPDVGVVHGEAHCYHQSSDYWSHDLHRTRQDLEVDGDLFQALIEARYRIITCTAMYRSDLYRQIASHPSFKRAFERFFVIGDTPIWLEMSRISRFAYIDEPFGVHRLLDESASQSQSSERKLSFGMEMLRLRIHYMEHYCVAHELVQKTVEQRAKSLLALASRIGNVEIVEELWALMNAAGVKYSVFDRIYRYCASTALGRKLASLFSRVELRLMQR